MNDTQPKHTGEGIPGGYGKPWRVPTGEWTAGSVRTLFETSAYTREQGWKAIADAHNAALAAEREKYQRSREKVREYFNLLAAEREQSARNVSALAKAHQQQLDAEREKHSKEMEEVEECNVLGTIHGDALRKHMAAAQKPLVDALKRIAEGAGETLHGYEPAEIAKAALEKVVK